MNTKVSSLNIENALYKRDEANYPMLCLQIDGKQAYIHASEGTLNLLKRNCVYLEGCFPTSPGELAHRSWEDVLGPIVIKGQTRRGITRDPRIVVMAKEFIHSIKKNIFTERTVEVPSIIEDPFNEGSQDSSIETPEKGHPKFIDDGEIKSDIADEGKGADYDILCQWLLELAEGTLGTVTQAMMYQESLRLLEKASKDLCFPNNKEQTRRYHHRFCDDLAGQGSDTTDGSDQNLTGQRILNKTYSWLQTCAQTSLERIFPELGYGEHQKDTVKVYTTESKVHLQGLKPSDTHIYPATALKRYPIVTGWFTRPSINELHSEVLEQEVPLCNVYALFTDVNNELRVAFTHRSHHSFKYLATHPKEDSEIKAEGSKPSMDDILDDVEPSRSNPSNVWSITRILGQKLASSFKVGSISKEEQLPS